VLQVLEGTTGLSGRTARTRFLGESFRLPVSRHMLGRIFDGLGRPADGGPPPLSADRRDINGLPINPTARRYPREFIQTGLSAVDGMNALVRGQKLPIFSGNGLPHDRVSAQIVRQARLLEEEAGFSIVFAAMGVKHDVAAVLHPQLRGFRSALARGHVPLPRRRPQRGAPADTAHGADLWPSTWPSTAAATCSCCSPT
jgi:V/A-type H+-transporting ATPase subunit B